ncbi:MAG: hypothetical protein HY904_07335 [Deltaproteobacteria bacterium]|nr:hypothetical protein [Deltaproteobacteria bacterium]
MLTWVNRGRADPNNVALGTAAACSTSYPAAKPLMLDHAGNRAARFHCNNLQKTNSGFSHNSYCTIMTDVDATDCDGSDACACVAGTQAFGCGTMTATGTDPFTRAHYFGFTAAGASMAVNANGRTMVEAGITECASGLTDRSIFVAPNVDSLGTGWAGANSCFGSCEYLLTATTNVTTAVLPSAIHQPETSTTATTFSFHANYYDPGGAPSRMEVVIDGACTPMTLELGTATNATYKASAPLSAACHQYWILSVDSAGARHAYPEAGAWGVGTCTAWSATATPALCEGGSSSGSSSSSSADASSASASAAATSSGGRTSSAPDSTSAASASSWSSSSAAGGSSASPAADSGSASTGAVSASNPDETAGPNARGCSAADAADGGMPGILSGAVALLWLCCRRRQG